MGSPDFGGCSREASKRGILEFPGMHVHEAFRSENLPLLTKSYDICCLIRSTFFGSYFLFGGSGGWGWAKVGELAHPQSINGRDRDIYRRPTMF